MKKNENQKNTAPSKVGRPTKFKGETKPVRFRAVPVSKVDEIKGLVYKKLAGYVKEGF